jgi:Protein of unknown function DUF2625
MKFILFLILLIGNQPAFAQPKMRPLSALINTKEPGWALVKTWIDTAKNKVEILPADSSKAGIALYETQVTTRSPMGAIIFGTGGLLIDGGWIRILGSGSPRLPRSLPDWNRGKTFKEFGDSPPFLLIADDAKGGFFLLNGGGLGKDLGKVYYFSPDDLEFEALDLTYSDFLLFCFNNDLEDFYKPNRWKGWQKDIAKLAGDQAYHIFPPLFSKEGKDIEKDTRNPIPIEELYNYQLDMRRKIGVDNKQK